MKRQPPELKVAKNGFTILELLVCAALIFIIASLTLSILNATTSVWNRHKAGVAAYGDARVVLEAVANRTAQATLNPYWDYDNRQAPQRYLRRSDLHFIQGPAATLLPDIEETSTSALFFAAPLGISADGKMDELVRMLSACGFYVQFGPEPARPPFLESRLPQRYRYRLFQLLQPGEQLAVYEAGDRDAWYRSAVGDWSFPLADNVIGLIVRARYPSAGGETATYFYDSRQLATPLPPTLHQLPPVLMLTMVILDEVSAAELARQYGQAAPPVLPEEGTFAQPDQFDDDLRAWEAKLQAMNLNYKVFFSEVYIRGAKWSSM